MMAELKFLAMTLTAELQTRRNEQQIKFLEGVE
jgi:hypothetical protein